MPRPLLIPVEALVKHDRNRYPGDKYGLEPALVANYVKRNLVRLNVEVLDNPTAPERVKDAVEEFRALLSDAVPTQKPRDEGPTGGRTDPNLEYLNGLAYNRGAESIVGFAKAVAEHLGLDGPPGRTRPALTDFLLSNFETLEELRK